MLEFENPRRLWGRELTLAPDDLLDEEWRVADECLHCILHPVGSVSEEEDLAGVFDGLRMG